MKSIVSLLVAIVIAIGVVYLTAGVSFFVFLLGSNFPVLPAAGGCYLAFCTGVGLANEWVPPPLTFMFVLSIMLSVWAFAGRISGGLWLHLAAFFGAPIALCLIGFLCASLWSAIFDR